MTRVLVTVGEQSFFVALYSNPAAQALEERLPLTLTMEELNGNEKFHYLSEPLPTDAESPGHIKTGELMLYGSDCLVLFYQDFPTAYSYTKLGWMEDASGLGNALGQESVQVTFTAG